MESINGDQPQIDRNEDEEWWETEDQEIFDATSTAREAPSAENAAQSAEKAIDEAALRKAILKIQSDTSIDRKEKARLMQYLMSHGSLPPPPSTDGKSTLLSSAAHKPDNADGGASEAEAYSKSYHSEDILGCKHYQRKVKLEANCCKRIFPCRFCHDDASDHNIVRSETKNMLCMLCMTFQPASQTCRQCNAVVARYYCDKCKLWDDDPEKSIYHCDDCGICRQGKGLGKDFFHCNKCNICMSIVMKDKHRCIERNLESDCPICGEYMFTSTSTVIFMPCGHCIHKVCYTAYIQTSYQCPTCLKSLGDMSQYFARLDRELERQPMPPEYEKYIAHIFCNDCERKSPAKYHFFYHKCAHCGSYNTTVLKTENTEETAQNSGDEERPNTSSSISVDAVAATSDALGLLSISEPEQSGTNGAASSSTTTTANGSRSNHASTSSSTEEITNTLDLLSIRHAEQQQNGASSSSSETSSSTPSSSSSPSNNQNDQTTSRSSSFISSTSLAIRSSSTNNNHNESTNDNKR